MKLIVDIPETAYEAFKEWHKNKVATIEQSLIANGIPYEEVQHGEWIPIDTVETHYYCKSCGGNGDSWDKFCRHCGADMRRKE